MELTDHHCHNSSKVRHYVSLSIQSNSWENEWALWQQTTSDHAFWCRQKLGVKISDTLQIRVVYLLCCCMLYFLVSPNVYDKENGKLRKKETRNTTIKNGKNEEKGAKRKRNTRHKNGMISVFPSFHVNLKVMHRSLKLMFRKPDNSRHSVNIFEVVLTPVKMCFLNTIWSCTKQLPLQYTVSELMAISNSLIPTYYPEKQLNSFFPWGYKTHSGCVYFTALYRALVSSRTRLLDHIQRRSTVGRTPLNERSVRRRHIYLTTQNTHNRQTSMTPVGFEPMIAAGERP